MDTCSRGTRVLLACGVTSRPVGHIVVYVTASVRRSSRNVGPIRRIDLAMSHLGNYH